MVGGSAAGLRLLAPAGPGTRPTADRTKEAVFAALGSLTGAAVLDLYAGSGALAVEALSRGAARAVLVERDRRALDVIRTNLATTGLAAHARVDPRSVRAVLAGGPPSEAPFDLVLVDPPYDTPAGDLETVLGALAGPGWLAPGALVVLERPRTEDLPALPPGWRAAWRRSYGDTLVVLAAAAPCGARPDRPPTSFH